MSSFVDKLQQKIEHRYPSQERFLRQSSAAACYDAVVMLAIALNGSGEYETANSLNRTLSDIKLKGLSVSM